jgi:EmrB/QacA subfamily drug resistance transporter
MTTDPTIRTPTGNGSPASATLPDRRRWIALGVVSVAVFITTLDGLIVNIALPTLSTELGATNRQLQWIVDAYLLVFTGLLLASGGLGDRFGRRRVLLIGLAVFGATSAYSAFSGSANELIFGRALMGIGAAAIFPATLAIITSMFTVPKERAAAIGIWSAVAGMGVAAGPVAGGWLLEYFWWGSVFLVNVPIVIIAIIAVLFVVPESKESGVPKLDWRGGVLSIAALGALVFTIIEAPVFGWLSIETLAGFAISILLLGTFVWWQLRIANPLLPVRIFENLRFTAASVSITAAFFALFGFIFLITQYFQLVRGYGPLEAGLRTIPVAASIAIGSVLSPKLVERIGTKLVVASGLGLMSAGFFWVSFASATTPYLEIVGQMILLGLGLGCTTAPATESIMGSLSVDKAGVGSAVNDTTRELGGTLGVAVIGSVFSSVYVASLRDGPVFSALSPDAQNVTQDSVAAAGAIAPTLGPDAALYLSEVSEAFLSGLSVACLAVAAVTLAGCMFALRFLPARATS